MAKQVAAPSAPFWIAKALEGKKGNKGLLRKKLGVPAGRDIPKGLLKKTAKKKGAIGKEARLAETLESFHKKKRPIERKKAGVRKKAGKRT